ncbi:putative TIR domain, P-loop containing nucleoside triphosphate hydrolase [Helianthus debilis subsp. tardiflorus]
MAFSSSFSHSAAASSRSWRYDVFLSFRGEDTRKTFVDHLYMALTQHLISVYKDDETLPRGESFRPSLFKAIEESRVAVIIFTKNYADSSWCLEELEYIMKCRYERELMVLPIFYDVEPSHVRNQKRSFGKAFAKHNVKNSSKAESWRKALVDASNISGWEPKHINGHESQVIRTIVDTIANKLFSLNSNVDEDLVGMGDRLQDLESQLDLGSPGVLMVGIWGVGGSGKTTLAKSVFLKIHQQFQVHCILQNVREESFRFGLKRLQELMLSDSLKKEVILQSVEEGKVMIKSKLCHRKVLVLLDDVNDLEQLEALAGSHNWFGSGSRIIITTREQNLLITHKVDLVSPVRLLSNEEAIQLIKRHAYNEERPVEDYETLSLQVVSYAAGLPLALKVLGSFLYDKDKHEWKSALQRLRYIPDLEVTSILKISYDGLESYQKDLFLDITCIWRGRRLDDAMDILEACDYHPLIGIKVLRQKALINIVDGYIDMHDLVQEMGHYIVRGEYPNNPEKHSRVWKREEINDMCFSDATMLKENDKIEVVRYTGNSSRFYEVASYMKKLRYIDCDGCPANPFPDSFQPTTLAALKLEDSLQKKVWNGCKILSNLKVLQLKHMKKLLITPDFDGLPNLQKLTLSYCSKLKEIPQSLGKHRRLEYVSISRCPKLRMFPTIVHMEKLKTLEIEACHKIQEFPEIQACMESLVELSLKWIEIEVLPSSIGERCTNLISLHLSYLKNLQSIEFNFDALKQLENFTLQGLNQLEMTRPQLFEMVFHQFPRCLRELDLSACCLEDGEIPSDISELCTLQELNLSWNDFSRLDFSLSQLTQLKRLNISGCEQLLELPKLPSSLAILNADSCKSLVSFGDSHTKCEWLCQVSLMGGSIINDGRRLLQYMLEGKATENGSMLLQLTDTNIPKGFIPNLLMGSRCGLQLPGNWCNDFSGFLMCVVFTNDFDWLGDCVSITIRQTMHGMYSQDDVLWEESESDMRTWVGYVSFGSLRHTSWWDQTFSELSFNIKDKDKECSGFGVQLVPKKCRSGLTETSTVSYYTPNLMIQHDWESALTISLTAYDGNQ